MVGTTLVANIRTLLPTGIQGWLVKNSVTFVTRTLTKKLLVLMMFRLGTRVWSAPALLVRASWASSVRFEVNRSCGIGLVTSAKVLGPVLSKLTRLGR